VGLPCDPGADAARDGRHVGLFSAEKMDLGGSGCLVILTNLGAQSY